VVIALGKNQPESALGAERLIFTKKLADRGQCLGMFVEVNNIRARHEHFSISEGTLCPRSSSKPGLVIQILPRSFGDH
jgi:hypothetical protein